MDVILYNKLWLASNIKICLTTILMVVAILYHKAIAIIRNTVVVLTIVMRQSILVDNCGFTLCAKYFMESNQLQN